MRAKTVPVRIDLPHRDVLAGRLAYGRRNIFTVLLDIWQHPIAQRQQQQGKKGCGRNQNPRHNAQ
jgi:hypothetical protein